ATAIARSGTRASSGRSTGGWGGLALLRLGLSTAMTTYAVTYDPLRTHPSPAHLIPAALALAALPAPIAIAQLTPRFRNSRRLAVAGLAVDTLAVFATLALFAFDPRRYVLALVVVVQAEGGAVLGVPGGLLAWLATSIG